MLSTPLSGASHINRLLSGLIVAAVRSGLPKNISRGMSGTSLEFIAYPCLV
jgi:hypothetical protein